MYLIFTIDKEVRLKKFIGTLNKEKKSKFLKAKLK